MKPSGTTTLTVFWLLLAVVTICSGIAVAVAGICFRGSWPEYCAAVAAVLSFLYFRSPQIKPTRLAYSALALAFFGAGQAVLVESPWSASVSVVLCCFALTDSSRDRLCTDRPLSTISFIPLLILGLPRQLVIEVEGAHCLSMASISKSIARFCCFPQLTDGNSILFSTGSVSVESFATGLWQPQVAALALTVWGILIGRSAVQHLLSIMIAAGLSVSVSTLFCCLETFNVMSGPIGLFSSYSQLPGIGSLFLLPLLLSADALVIFFTGPVGDPEEVSHQEHVEEVQEDPVVVLWNQWIAGFQPSFAMVASFQANDGKRIRLLRSLTYTVYCWFTSRSTRHMVCALPAAVSLLLYAVTPFVIHRPISWEINSCQRHLVDSLNAQCSAETDFNHRALIALQPQNHQLKYNYAMWLWNHEQQQQAWNIMNEIAPAESSGFAPAHLWLAENAGNVEGQYFIAEPVRISHLLSAVAGLRGSGDLTARARSLLARCLLNSAEPQLAMWQLEAAADKDPRYLLELGAIQALRGKSLKGDHRLQAYREVLLKTLKANPKHVTDHTETAVFAARASLLLEEPQVAAAILRSAIPHTRSPEIHQLLADVTTRLARSIWDSKTVDIASMLTLLQEANTLKPANPPTLLLLVELELLGVQTGLEQSQGLRELASSVAGFDSANTAGEKLEAAFLAAILTNDDRSAVRAATIICGKSPHLATRAVALYRKLQQPDKSNELANRAIQACPQENVSDIVKLLRAAGQYQVLRKLCENHAAPDSWTGEMTHSYFHSLIDEFDSRLQAPPVGSSEYRTWLPVIASTEATGDLLRLLERATTHTATRLSAVDRLARLMLNENPLKEGASAILRASRVDASDVAQMLEIAGYVALQTSHFAEAAAWLEQATVVCRNPHPALLNNLAIAMLRHDSLNLAPRALLYAEQAIKLEPNRAELLCTRAEIRLSLRRWADAQRDLRHVLNQKPNHPEALRLLRQVANIAAPRQTRQTN